MKIKSLEIVNMGIIIKEKIVFDKPLTLFFGEIMQGKTTILNSVKYALGGKFPADVLRHGTDKGFVRIVFDHSSIRRTFRRAKGGMIKAEKIEFICDGVLEAKPIDAIKQFLNPFLLDQDFFANKTELERNRYFIELFGVDVSGIDKDIKATDEAAKMLRATIKGYGEIDVTPVEPADVYALAKERRKLLDVYASKKLVLDNQMKDAAEYNENYHLNEIDLSDTDTEIEKLKAKLCDARERHEKILNWLAENNLKDQIPSIPLPDTKTVDEQISGAKAQNERHKRYIENKARYDDKRRLCVTLSQRDLQLRELRDEKIKKLSSISDKSGISGLVFDENAQAKYESSTLGMLSHSQIMRLSSILKSLYPEGFGIELIDGAESTGIIYGSEFGEPVNFYIEKAKREETTILATVVGQKPAVVPEDVGVFIVIEGALK